MSVLDEKVLLLNRLMYPLRLISVRKAFFLLTKPRRKDPSTSVATALEVDENRDIVRPVKWEEWLSFPIREDDRVISTTKQKIRVPSIIILADFDRLVVGKTQLNKRSLWERQKGRCMYSTKPLKWDNCDIDHYIPRAKAGKTSWTNCGLTSIEYNRMKGDKLAPEVGLKLRLPLIEPPPKPLFVHLRRNPRFPEWDVFIKD